MITLVAFLGNYGREYERTRHNVAWLFADSLDILRPVHWQKKFKGQFAVLDGFVSRRLYFLKPETYMNLSGESIGETARFYKIPPEQILIVHDELELSPGTVSLKKGGGLGGHNGLRSVKAVLGTPDFWRLRFGIGRPSHSDIAGYVLSGFSPEENSILTQIFPPAAELLCNILSGDPENYLPIWNKKNLLSQLI